MASGLILSRVVLPLLQGATPRINSPGLSSFSKQRHNLGFPQMLVLPIGLIGAHLPVLTQQLQAGTLHGIVHHPSLGLLLLVGLLLVPMAWQIIKLISQLMTRWNLLKQVKLFKQ